MSKRISWIHLSDFHARKWDDWDSHRVRSALVADLEALRDKDQVRPDFIFFTGDAAYGEFKDEEMDSQYAEFGNFLDAIRNIYDPPIAKNNVFVVPGNHDVARSEVSDGETAWLRSGSRQESEIIGALRSESKQRKVWMDRLDNYKRFLRDYGVPHSGAEDPNLIWATTRKVDEITVGIVGLNSAWSCCDDRDKGLMWTGGSWQVGELITRKGPSDFTIALIHHPGNWFGSQEDPKVQRELRRSFEFVLHGHEHKENIDVNTKDHVLISAGACYQCSWMENGYNFCKIDIENASAEVMLRTWDENGGGWVAKNIAHDAPHGTREIPHLQWLKNLNEAAIDIPLVATSDLIASSIADSEKETSAIALEERLKAIRRRSLPSIRSHELVRKKLTYKFKDALGLHRFCWVISDWQMGLDGFLGAALNKEFDVSNDHIFRVDCGRIESAKDILQAAEAQLGLPFVEFADIVKVVNSPTLILNDIPVSIASSDEQFYEINKILDAILDFSGSIRIVITARRGVTFPFPQESCIELAALDIDEMIDYVEAQPAASNFFEDKSLIEQVYVHTSGLPGAIDRLLFQRSYLSLSEILAEDGELTPEEVNEPIPQSLIDAISKLTTTSDQNSRRAFELLKLLTVLKDGETLESIRRFYHVMPFYKGDVSMLVKSALLESIPIAKSSGELLPSKYKLMVKSEDNQWLLRVPRQVRDYVGSLITEEERSRIYQRASESFFGARWTEGKIKLRRSLFYAYQDSSIVGPGNELLIAQYFLRVALNSRRADRIERYVGLAMNYAAELMEEDRFRDVVIATGAIMSLLNKYQHTDHWVVVASLHGRALRLTGQSSKAIVVLEDVRSLNQAKTKSFKANILLNLALAYIKVDEDVRAILYALEVVRLEEKDSAYAIHARSIVARKQLTGGKREAALKNLWRIARSQGHKETANNILLDLARYSSKEDSLKHLDAAIKNSGEPYSKTRAIIDKVDLLRRDNKLSMLTLDERSLLCYAYAYTYSQRIDFLLDSCHDALWDVYEADDKPGLLLRLFRYSSFVWRLNGRIEREGVYLEKAAVLVDSEKLGFGLDVELKYVQTRLGHSPSTTLLPSRVES